MNESHSPLHPFFREAAILFPVLILAGIGIVMVHSASADIGAAKFGNHLHFMKKQALFFILGIGAMFTAASLPFQFLKTFVYLFLIGGLGLLVAVLIPSIGLEAGGASRWIAIAGLSFQPAELMKLILILYLGYSLAKKQEKIGEFSVGFFPHVIVLMLISVLIMMQPDFGTVLILAMITWAMMFMAGVRITHLLFPVPFLIPLGYFFVYKVDYRMERIMTFLNPWDDPLDKGYQITHSLKAFGSGGLFGRGIGLGMQKLNYLPEPHTDFILSVIGEELGLMGVLCVLALYSVILWRGTVIARSSKNLFGALVAAGLTFSLGVQVIINTGVALGVLPTKGLTLPFLSYGGTSLLITMVSMGILMNIGATADHD